MLLELAVLASKRHHQKKSKAFSYRLTRKLLTPFKEHLGFELTRAQKRAINEIFDDLQKSSPMSRLLQGDVGSGKTIVGFICILVAIGGGAQAALMAPTEILAQQHYANLKKYADKMRISIALLTGSVKKSDRKPIHKGLEDGSLKILIGTHALLEEEVKFNKLGLAIID